jgi:DNA-binding LytR/AlgR family response regulator
VKLRALVVEDEWATRNYLVELLHASRAVEVVGAVASLDGARQVLEPSPTGGAIGGASEAAIDVAFVDVQLVGSDRDDDGLALVRAHAGRPGAPRFVLATAFREHALEAFELGVVDYLLKPFSEDRIARCLERVRAHRPVAAAGAPQLPARIVARRKRALVFLRLDEVWAFEAAERLAYVHTARGRFEVDLSLSAIEASIGHALLRAHRNWLVNADHVRELEGHGSDTELRVGAASGEPAGVRVPVARDRAQAVREALLRNAMGIRPR